MRAVIVATGRAAGVRPLDDRRPAPLLPLVDRPFLQHVVEFYGIQGIKRFDFVLSHLPDRIEHHLGDGTRWGCRFTFHLARDPSAPYRVLKATDCIDPEAGPILFGHADRLPLLPLEEAAKAAERPLLLARPGQAEAAPAERWAGWAVLLPQHLAALPADAGAEDCLDQLLGLREGGPAWHEVPVLDVSTFGGILAAHQAVLGKDVSGLLLSSREADPGIWLSRNVRLHPSIQFFPPVFIGENSDIGAGVKLGPHAVIGPDCVLEAHSTVTRSVVFPGSYVGEGLDLADVIVDKNRLVNASLGEAVVLTDDFLLGSMSEGLLGNWFRHLLARSVALLALILASPVLLVLALGLALFRRGPVLHRQEAVRLPTEPAEDQWRTFHVFRFLPADPDDPPQRVCSFRGLWLWFFPALLNVVRGELAFVGLPPRSPEEVRVLPEDWRALYLRAKGGIVTEASLHGPGDLTEDQRYAADAYYVATATWRYDLKLLARYLGRSLFGFLQPRRTEEAEEARVGGDG